MSIETLAGENADLKAANLKLRNRVKQLEHCTKEQETAIEELQNRVDLMFTVFNSISDGVIVADEEGEFLFWNPVAEGIVGLGATEVDPEEWTNVYGTFYPDEVTVFPSTELPLYKAIQGEITDNVEVFIRNQNRPDGVHIIVTGRPLYNQGGDLIGGVVVFYDITQLNVVKGELETTVKELQVQNDLMQVMNNQLEAQKQLLHSIFHSISDGVLVAGRTSNIIMANLSAKRILGSIPFLKSSDEWFRPDLYFYPDKVTPFPMEEHPIFKGIWGKSTNNVEMFIQSEESSGGIHASVSGRPLHDAEGNYAGSVTVFHDISDRIKMEEELARAFTQGRLEIVDTILHNIGNAINSVSVGIDTVYSMLADEPLITRLTALADALQQHEDNLSDYIENDPQGQKVVPFLVTLAYDFQGAERELRQTVERIRGRAQHIVDIIRTQDSYHNTRASRKDIKLADAISDALKILQDSIEKRQIQTEIDCAKAPEEIRIQESQFHQVLVNLIKNSIEAIDELGKSDEAPRIQIRCYSDGDFLSIDITDNGIGIAPEDLNKIFAAGFTTKEAGNGLGLHSSANFVISSGGKIQPLSEGKGKGTTMRILLLSSSIQLSHRQ